MTSSFFMVFPSMWHAHQCGLPTPQTICRYSFIAFRLLVALLGGQDLLLVAKHLFVAARNCGVGLRSYGGLADASRYGIKADGTAIVMTTLAAGTLPWSDGGRVAFETPRQHAGAPLAATSWAHSRSLDALPLIRDLLLSANQLFVHRQR